VYETLLAGRLDGALVELLGVELAAREARDLSANQRRGRDEVFGTAQATSASKSSAHSNVEPGTLAVQAKVT